jgi:hypothetical protein
LNVSVLAFLKLDLLITFIERGTMTHCTQHNSTHHSFSRAILSPVQSSTTTFLLAVAPVANNSNIAAHNNSPDSSKPLKRSRATLINKRAF